MAAAELPLQVVLIGYGEISRNQHAPILGSRRSRLELVSIVDPGIVLNLGTADASTIQVEGHTVPLFSDLPSALNDAVNKNRPLRVAVVACPPEFAQDHAEIALEAGLDVFLEKPPGLDCERLDRLESLARSQHRTLFTAYHSTVAPEVPRAKEWVQRNKACIANIHITWKESVTKWHPGQSWITENELGVLDMLINPISMVEEIIGTETMSTMVLNLDVSSIAVPENWKGPISGFVLFRGKKDPATTIAADFAWDHEGEDIWTIAFRSNQTTVMELSDGGAWIAIDGVNRTHVKPESDILRPEYEQLYDGFEMLAQERDCWVQSMPLRLVNDLLKESRRVRGKGHTLA